MGIMCQPARRTKPGLNDAEPGQRRLHGEACWRLTGRRGAVTGEGVE